MKRYQERLDREVSEDETVACPECDSSAVDHRRVKDPDWRCTDCGSTFDDVTIREKMREHPGNAVKVRCIECGETFRHGDTDGRIKCSSCEEWQSMKNARRYWYMTEKWNVSRVSNGPITGITARGPSRDVESISVPSSTSSGETNGWRSCEGTTVYYLPGDEREAMRLFARENEQFVRQVFEEQPLTPIQYHWPEVELELLRDAWFAVKDDLEK